MTLGLHREASASFNKKAQSLLAELLPEQRLEAKSSAVPSDAYVTQTISQKDIIEIGHKSELDVTGRTVARFFFEEDGGWIGLTGEAYKKLVELADTIHRRREICNYLSRDFIEGEIFSWLEDKYSGKVEISAIEHLLHVGSVAIDDLEVWFPIPTLSTTVSFSVGRIEFRPLSKDLISGWQEVLGEGQGGPELAKKFVTEMRKKIQGLAAAAMRVVAEPIRAREIALDQTEKSTAALRLFSPEILHPYGRSFWEPLSFPDQTSFDVFFTKDGHFSHRHTHMPVDRVGHGSFDKEKLITLFSMGLSKVDTLLRTDDPTPFQTDCLNALFQYSKAALKGDPSEKLLYIISALESIFLTTSYEGGIGKNLEERLAVFIRREFNERLSLMKRVRAVYKLRSDFVHHSLPVSDLALVETFMVDARAAFHNLLLASSVYTEKADFIRDLENHRIAGPSYDPLQFR